MALAQIQPCRRHGSSETAKVKVRPLAQRPNLVPEAKVTEMLQDIAFILSVTRRLTNEIKATKLGVEVAKA